MILALILYVILNGLDLATTTFALSAGMREFNPFFSTPGKVIATIVTSVFFLLLRERPITRYVVWGLNIILLSVVIWNLANIYRFVY